MWGTTPAGGFWCIKNIRSVVGSPLAQWVCASSDTGLGGVLAYSLGLQARPWLLQRAPAERYVPLGMALCAAFAMALIQAWGGGDRGEAGPTPLGAGGKGRVTGAAGSAGQVS